MGCCVALGVFGFAGGNLRAGQALDTSSPINFFNGTANLLLQNAGYNFTVTNIPIYPTNYYTPALHRLLQLAANLYDSTTNRAFSDGSSPNGPYYPSVFRPTFNRTGSNVFIAGYVEEGDGTTSYNAIPLSLPDDWALVSATTTNIYGIPWVIGARKGFPNFNELSLACAVQITRKIEVVNLFPGTTPPVFQTNVQYIIGVSNTIGVEAWNSYSNAYPRAVDLFGVDNLSLSLSNEMTLLYATNGNGVNGQGWRYTVQSNAWPGATPNATHQFNVSSLQIPLLTNITVLSDSVYQSTPIPHLGFSTNFDTNANVVPGFVLNMTNTLRFIMLDHATGRVIDYVHLDGMSFRKDLAAELNGADGGGPGGVWLTNLTTGGQVQGVINQTLISEGFGGELGFPASGWIAYSLQGNSHIDAAASFNAFLNGRGGVTNSFQAPFTPTRKVVTIYTWQANDPFVHYTLSDLTLAPFIAPSITTNYPVLTLSTNFLTNIGQINQNYLPWNNAGNAKGARVDEVHLTNPAVKDPLVTRSDDWNFPTGEPLTLATLGRVHRGTPWQTVYLKAAGESLADWQSWTGDTLTNVFAMGSDNTINFPDAALSLPTNDWGMAAALLPLMASQHDPHFLYGFNQPSASAWAGAFQGLTVLTNAPTGLIPLVIDASVNSNAIGQIVAGINAERAMQLGGLFTNVTALFAVPQLSLLSPFLNTGSTTTLNDAAYESLPLQLLPLLRPDPIGSVSSVGGGMEVRFTGFDGYAYWVQASTNLVDWETVGMESPTNGVLTFLDGAGFAGRFYRTVLGP